MRWTAVEKKEVGMGPFDRPQVLQVLRVKSSLGRHSKPLSVRAEKRILNFIKNLDTVKHEKC